LEENIIKQQILTIEGLDCSDCALVVEHSLSRMDGVLSARVNYAAQTLSLEYDAHQTSRRAIVKRIGSLGYQIGASGGGSWLREHRELLQSLLAGVALVLGWAGGKWMGLPPIASEGLYLSAYVLAGFDVARHAWGALIARSFNYDLLMVLAAMGAAALGEFAEGALLLFLFSLGHALEERTMDRARSAIRALGQLAPKVALVRRDQKETEVPVDALEVGETVIIRPGVRVPVDGEVIAGQSSVDQAPVTGESVQVEVGPGQRVFAGSINVNGALEVRVARLARDSTLARVMRLVERAQGQKSSVQLATEKFTRIFVPAVLVGVLAVIVILPLFGVPFREAFLRAMTLLVASSPCALALGTPAAVLAGVAQAARNGVLVKGSIHLENLGRLRVIAFDKTGTLTYGRPTVTGIIPLKPGLEEAELLRVAAAVESRSAHPLAEAIVRAAYERGLEIPHVEASAALTGRGARATVSGVPVWVGGLKLLEGSHDYAEIRSRVAALESGGQTGLIVQSNGEVLGLLVIADELRLEVKAALEGLERSGVHHSIMLTGDSPQVAERIASQAGLSEYRASLLPEDKVDVVRALIREHGLVGMVGDGVNDAPALAEATVGIAMGGAATDVALEVADVALMADDLSKLPFAISLGRATQSIIQQNLWIAAGVIAGLVALALTGHAGIGLAIFLHEGSTLLVVINALRLLRHGPQLVV
jgi:Cd2+/Zn2+-exporting ATPase